MTSPRDLIGTALFDCSECGGTGVRLAGHKQTEAVCACCFRSIARCVLARVRQYGEASGYTIKCNMTQFGRGSNRTGRRENGRKGEELIADAYLIARRALSTLEFDIYKRHFLKGEPWTAFPHIVRGQFFHSCYRIEQKLGERFVNLKPYPLFPLDGYMSSDYALNGQADVRAIYPRGPSHPNGIPLVPPLQPAPVVVEVAQPVLPKPKPVSVMPSQTVPEDAEDYIRRRFKEGISLISIARSMTQHGFEPPNGSTWQASSVKKILMARRAA